MEKKRFEATSKVTRESCRALAKAKVGQHSRVIWVINALIALCVAALWAVRSPSAGWLTALLLLLVAQNMLRRPITAAVMYATRSQTAEGVKLTFDDEGIGVRTRVENSRLRYDAVIGLREDDRFLILLFRNHTPLVVEKSGVTGGGIGELTAFLTRRTGCEVRALRS